MAERLRAFHVFTGLGPDDWSVLVFSATPSHARAMCVGHYGGDEAYTDLHARRLPHMDAFAPPSPCVLDSEDGDLAQLSGIYGEVSHG